MAIKNIEELRKHAAMTLEKLEKGKIDNSQAAVNAKLYESIVSSLKTELEYHKMLKQMPEIEFLDCADVRVISQQKTLKIEKNK
jgi:hypothetical protein